MSAIFISYRKTDTSAEAALVADRLNRTFGPGTAFLDYQSIPLGTDFRATLWRELENCRAVVAVIGPNWLQPDASGCRRIEDPDDFVRLELDLALSRNMTVVPLLVRGADKPSIDTLPRSLAALPDRQYLTLHARSTDRDLDHLVADLGRSLAVRQVGPTTKAARDRNGITFNGKVKVGGDIVDGDKWVFGRG